jgi:hypothetical protein
MKSHSNASPTFKRTRIGRANKLKLGSRYRGPALVVVAISVAGALFDLLVK